MHVGSARLGFPLEVEEGEVEPIEFFEDFTLNPDDEPLINRNDINFETDRVSDAPLLDVLNTSQSLSIDEYSANTRGEDLFAGMDLRIDRLQVGRVLDTNYWNASTLIKHALTDAGGPLNNPRSGPDVHCCSLRIRVPELE
jgi:hypothetical protein